MPAWTWLGALAPLVLCAPWALPSAPAARMARWALGAAAIALGVAIFVLFRVASHGPLASPLLGADGIGFSLYVDALSAIMLVLVAFIGCVVMRYSQNYLAGDPQQGLFFKLLAATIASVATLVIAGNLALMLAAWIVTNLFLNRLLLFYSARHGAMLAARKKFVFSRLSEALLIAAAVLLYSEFGTLQVQSVLAGVSVLSSAAAAGIALCLVGAALFASAQFPFHGWILEVMETPTPVSALLHAGVINAGGFLLIRFSELITIAPAASAALIVIGGATALFGSLVMLTQSSIKVSLAYSTIAQMGFMLMQCGFGAFAGALLHIVAHSLYKAHAFLSSGSVVDVLRASWSPSPSGAPHAGRFTLALGGVLSVAVGMSVLLGADMAAKPGVFVLGAIMLMGLTLLIANAIDERGDVFVIGSAIGAALGAAALYFALQWAAEVWLHGSVAPTRPLQGALEAWLVAAIVISFAAVTWLQSQWGLINRARLGRAFYVHLSQGLYVNTLANRWALRFWPARPPAPLCKVVFS